MKRTKSFGIIIVLLMMLPLIAFGQFKDKARLPDMRTALTNPVGSLLGGLLNTDRMTMSHSFSFSYANIGGHGLLLNTYLNTIHYRISNPLWLQLQIGILNTPYNSLAPNSPATQFFGGADLFYQPSDKFQLHIGFQSAPYYYVSPWYLNRTTAAKTGD